MEKVKYVLREADSTTQIWSWSVEKVSIEKVQQTFYHANDNSSKTNDPCLIFKVVSKLVEIRTNYNTYWHLLLN